jgi:hypothetical protein
MVQQVEYPRSGGMAPTTAPTHVFTGCICFNGVYTNAYRIRLEAASPAAKPLAFQANKAVPATPTLVAHMAACAGLMRPDGRGRRMVLFILASFFISNT